MGHLTDHENEDDYGEHLGVRDWHYVHEVKNRFRLADGDGDGGLELREFHAFLHPEETDMPALHEHVVKHEIIDNDTDKDGRIDLEEFVSGLWYMFYGTEDWDSDYGWSEEEDQKQATDKFHSIDTDKDGYIMHVELVPLFPEMFRNEKHYAGIQARDVLQEADVNNDNRLTLAEMLQHSGVFYSLVDDHPLYSD